MMKSTPITNKNKVFFTTLQKGLKRTGILFKSFCFLYLSTKVQNVFLKKQYFSFFVNFFYIQTHQASFTSFVKLQQF